MKLTVKRIVRIAMFACILFAQEELLTAIPQVQLTQALITIYYYSFGLTDTLIIVLIHVLLDNLVMGSLNLMYTPAMLVGWMLLPLILHCFRFIKNKYLISLIVGLHAFIYSFCFVLVSVFIYKIEFLPYFIADLPWEIVLCVNGIITTLLLLGPLTKVMKKFTLEEKGEIKSEDKSGE